MQFSIRVLHPGDVITDVNDATEVVTVDEQKVKEIKKYNLWNGPQHTYALSLSELPWGYGYVASSS